MCCVCMCSWTAAVRWPWCFVDVGGVGWGGVGWGGACSNVHVNFALIRHARLLEVLLNFALIRHARLPEVPFELCTHTSLLASSHGFEARRAWTFHFAPLSDTICVHVVLAFQLRKSRSSKVLGRTGSAALTKRRLKTCEDEVVSGSATKTKMLVFVQTKYMFS